ncbi:MAG: type II toxin-antitoxin system VapC family toxin [Deltaproteobacteria bacterium]|nr:type II toxin-antitoxin system VapC family toxin [Deltaproteobacteria bacterium]
MKYLLDTCVISELVAKQSNPDVVAWVDNLDPDSVYLSVITIGEIRKGIEKLPDSKRKASLESWLRDELLVRFSGRIVSIDTDVMLTWGKTVGALELNGKKMSAIDSLITAIALHGNFCVATRNENDFQHAGVTIINPWK